ncbi:MAG TPA: MBL fold metallo-hydrolase [Smithella sp.]|nr:MBL fold metallo-hydrolase [Deltaproteobacteria bacterium]HOX99373.1 MBL fold metallo-hydrolase [Smithella sp.]
MSPAITPAARRERSFHAAPITMSGTLYPFKVNDSLWILGNGYFHLYLLKGAKQCALVETGISATADLVLSQLEALDVRPDYLVVTHPHSDHITGLDHLRGAFPGAVVMIAAGAASFVAHPKAAPAIIAEDRHMFRALAARGLFSQTAVVTMPPSLSGCRILTDGEALDLGGMSVNFLSVKGHSPGNLLAWIAGTKTLLVSDSLGNHYPGRGFFPTFFTGYNDYMATIDRLESFRPKRMGLAHNGFFSTSGAIADIFCLSRKSAQDVRRYIEDCAMDDEDLARSLFGFYYTDELAVYSPDNILNCCRLLVRRVRELHTA